MNYQLWEQIKEHLHIWSFCPALQPPNYQTAQALKCFFWSEQSGKLIKELCFKELPSCHVQWSIVNVGFFCVSLAATSSSQGCSKHVGAGTTSEESQSHDMSFKPHIQYSVWQRRQFADRSLVSQCLRPFPATAWLSKWSLVGQLLIKHVRMID